MKRYSYDSKIIYYLLVFLFSTITCGAFITGFSGLPGDIGHILTLGLPVMSLIYALYRYRRKLAPMRGADDIIVWTNWMIFYIFLSLYLSETPHDGTPEIATIMILFAFFSIAVLIQYLLKSVRSFYYSLIAFIIIGSIFIMYYA